MKKNITENRCFAAALVLAALAVILSCAFFAAGTELSRAADEVTLTGYIKSNQSTATAETPAYTNVIRDQDYAEGTTRVSWFRDNLTAVITYSGLTPGKTYRYKCITRSLEDGMSWTTTSSAYTVTPDETGSGTLTIGADIDPVNTFGLTALEFEFYDPDDESVKYKFAPDDNSNKVYLYGVEDVLVSRTDGKGNVGYGYLYEQEKEQAQLLQNDTKVRVRTPNAGFTMTATVVRINDNGSYLPAVTVLNDEAGNPVTTTAKATSDENGVLKFSHELPPLPTAKAGEKYTLRLRVVNDENAGEVYNYSFRSMYLVNRYYGPFLKGIFFCYDKLEEPEEEPTYVKVNVSNYISGTEKPLKGAKLKLVKGSDPAGEDVVSEWEETGEPHELLLEPGDYTLVQTSAPDGYRLAKPKQISLVDKDSDRRGNNFIAYTESIQANDQGQEIDIFHLLRDEGAPDYDTAYCINRGLTGPTREAPIDFTTGARLIYKEYDIGDPEFYQRLGTPRLPEAEIGDAIKRVVYSGYPNDKSGIKGKYGLTEAQYADVTQDAVHYYTDSTEFGADTYYSLFGKETGDKMYQALMALINATAEPPKDMTLKFYLPNSGSYQALVSTEFREDNIVIKTAIYNDKDEEEEEDHESGGDGTDDPDSGDGGSGGSGSGEDKEPPEQNRPPEEPGSVKTGDANGLYLYSFAALAALAAMGVLTALRKRGTSGRE